MRAISGQTAYCQNDNYMLTNIYILKLGYCPILLRMHLCWSLCLMSPESTEQCCTIRFQNYQICPRHPLLCFILFTGYLLSRGWNTNCPCFALRSFLISLPSTFQNFFNFTLLSGSSALLQTPECSEYHPSEQSPVVSALSLTRLQLSGTNSLFLSAILPLSALLNLP